MVWYESARKVKRESRWLSVPWLEFRLCEGMDICKGGIPSKDDKSPSLKEWKFCAGLPHGLSPPGQSTFLFVTTSFQGRLNFGYILLYALFVQQNRLQYALGTALIGYKFYYLIGFPNKRLTRWDLNSLDHRDWLQTYHQLVDYYTKMDIRDSVIRTNQTMLHKNYPYNPKLYE